MSRTFWPFLKTQTHQSTCCMLFLNPHRIFMNLQIISLSILPWLLNLLRRCLKISPFAHHLHRPLPFFYVLPFNPLETMGLLLILPPPLGLPPFKVLWSPNPEDIPLPPCPQSSTRPSSPSVPVGCTRSQRSFSSLYPLRKNGRNKGTFQSSCSLFHVWFVTNWNEIWQFLPGPLFMLPRNLNISPYDLIWKDVHVLLITCLNGQKKKKTDPNKNQRICEWLKLILYQ